MSSQPPYDPYNQPTPQQQYAQPSEYVPSTPYPPQPSDYAASAYPQPGYAPANPYASQPEYAYAPVQPERGRGLALAGMILGIISMVAWLLPLTGYPIAIVGLILSILGRRSVTRKGMALAGIILSAIALALTLCNSALGAYMAMHR